MDLDLLALLPSNERSIAVDTHLGHPIANLVAMPVDDRGKALYRALRTRHARWTQRKPAIGVYNCFGLLFASRRTAIYDDAEVLKALREDGYRVVELADVRIGDLVLYRADSRGTLLHGGTVSRVERMVGGSATVVPWVLSKWNDHFGEDEHHFRDVPWEAGSWSVEFWTDRPAALG